MSKNIEKIKGEDALFEIISVISDDVKLNGLVSNDVADMYQRASGLRPLKPIDTYESPIVELKANLKLIFRRLFSVPLTILGSNKEPNPISIIEMFRQIFNHYRERLKGSEEYGIPSRLAQLSDLPRAPLLLADRKISGVNAEIPDGVSMGRLLCDSSMTAMITEIIDDTEGWTLDKDPLATFPNATKLHLGCKFMTLTKLGNANTEDLQLEQIEELVVRDNVGTASRRSLLLFKNEVLNLPNLKSLAGTIAWSGAGFVQDNNYVKKINMPTLNYFMHGRLTGMISYCANLEEVNMGEVKALTPNRANGEQPGLFEECPKLIAVKVGKGFNNNLNLQYWSPTLDSSNLQQFLLNVRQYIMLRLATGTSLTLTLSPAVYKAVYGLDADYNVDPNTLAQTTSLGDLGIATEDLNEIEIAAGITTATKYATWLDTYRGAIYWNIGHA